eukprot:3524540-Pyramimonas_sp.AAC.1
MTSGVDIERLQPARYRSGPSISSEALWPVDLVRSTLVRRSCQNRSGPFISSEPLWSVHLSS